MTLQMSGTNTSLNEVTNISQAGFWLLVEDKEYFVPFNDYPEFKLATIEQIYNVKRIGHGAFYWEELDIDIELAALAEPDKYPLKFKR
ncbi:MAG: DUF2442 domain-containing protein [Geobacteraceae bacterium]|nr:DUF2442 domain-containing protein [Geobacteraceae bacterium]